MILNYLSPVVRTGVLLFILAPLFALEARAQESESEGADRSTSLLDEVTVTARRREEGAQSVPIAVTALSGQALEQRGVESMDDLKFFVPNMTMTPHSGKKNWGSPTLRGQRASESVATYDMPIGIYFNDVVAARSAGVLGTGLYDVQSVEVLKGPQGTLFGRNTTGGAVLVKTRMPEDEFEGYINATAGSRNLMDVTAAISIPVSDSFKLRLAGKRVTQDGYLQNLTTGEDIADQDATSFRLTAVVEPSDSFSNTFIYDYTDIDAAGSGTRLVGAVPAAEGGVADFFVSFLGNVLGREPFASSPGLIAEMNEGLSGDFWHVRNTADNFEKIEIHTVSNTTTIEISEGITVKNILGYRDLLNQESNDLDGVALPLIHVGSDSRIDIQQITNEFQVWGNAFEDRLQWITGAYLFREWGEDNAQASSFGNPPTQTWGEVENISHSLFLQGTYALTDSWNLTIGGRYTWDDRELVSRSILADGTCRLKQPGTTDPLPSYACNKKVSKTFHEPTYTVSLDYQLSADTMVYGSYRRGYRSGGFNIRAQEEIQFEPVKPELIDSFELGVKSDWTLGDVEGRLNMAVFYDDYRDIQRGKSVPSAGTTPITLLANAAEATMKGVELELAAAPTENLELLLTYAYIDAGYDEWIDTTASGEIIDKSDYKFSTVPESQIGAAITYRLPLDESVGDISLRADYFWQDEMDAGNEPPRPAPEIGGVVPEFDVVNFRADWSGVMQSNIDLSAYVKNALNEEYYSGVMGIQIAFGIDVGIIAPPREYGLKLSYRF